MPLSPTALERNKPTLGQILVIIDKELIKSDKRALENAPYLSVDAPIGSLEFKALIINAYQTAGWYKVTYIEGGYREQARIRFFAFEESSGTPPPNVLPNVLPVVSLLLSSSAPVVGQVLTLTASASDSDGSIATLSIFNASTRLATSTTSPLVFQWTPPASGTYPLRATATDSQGGTASQEVTVSINPVVVPPVVVPPVVVPPVVVPPVVVPPVVVPPVVVPPVVVPPVVVPPVVVPPVVVPPVVVPPVVVPTKFHFAGDSITSGAVAQSWVEYLKLILSSILFPTDLYNNRAVSGESSNQQLSRLQAEIINNKTAGSDIAVLYVGVNDLRLGDAGTPHAGTYRTKYEIAHDILEWGRRARLAGLKPLLITFGADRRVVTSNPAEDARRGTLFAEVNTITLTNAITFGFVGVLNNTTDPLIGMFTSPVAYAGTYYLADGIHPSNQGEEYIATKMKTLIEEVVTNPLATFVDPGEYQTPVVVSPIAANGVRLAVVWQSAPNVSISGNSLTKVGGSASFDAGAINTIALGVTTALIRGSVDFIATKNALTYLVGFHNGVDSDGSYQQLIAPGAVAVQVCENPAEQQVGIRSFINGVVSNFTPYNEGDRVRIDILPTQVKIYLAGIEIRSVDFVLPNDCYLDTTILSVGTTISDVYLAVANPVVIISGSSPVEVPNTTPLSGTTQLFFLGDSITFGVATTYGFSYPQQVMTRLNNPTKFSKVQRGFSGQNAAWFNSNQLQNAINSFDHVNYNNIVCVVYFGTNDFPSTDVATFTSTINQTYTALKNAGAKVIIVPVLNRTDTYSNATYDPRRLAFNNYAYANYATIATELADLKLQPIYASVATTNTAFFAAGDPDGLTGVHPTNRGAACIAEEVAQAIARLHGITLSVVPAITATTPPRFGTQPPNPGISSSGIGNGAGMPLDVTPLPGSTGSTLTYQALLWNNVVNATVTNNGTTLTKTAGAAALIGNALSQVDSSWDASGLGVLKIDTTTGTGEKGAFKLLNVSNTRYALSNTVVGLSSVNPSAHYAGIQYAWYFNTSGLNIIESGSVKWTNGTTTYAYDTLEIVVSQSVVKYYASGGLVYTSLTAPVFPLLVDSSLMYVNQSFIADAFIAGVNLLDNPAAPVPVPVPTEVVGVDIIWENLVNVSLGNKRLTKTVGATAWNAGATSRQLINATSGTGEIARVIFPSVNQISGSKLFGLSHDNPDAGYTAIDYAYYTDINSYNYYENGTPQTGGVSNGITRTYELVVYNDRVEFLVSGVLSHTSTVAPTFPLFVDCSLYEDTSSAFVSFLENVLLFYQSVSQPTII